MVLTRGDQQRGSWVPAIAEWLASLGLSEYAQSFADNSIDDVRILRDLTDRDLKDVGVPLGHRRKMLRAITEIAGSPAATKPPAVAAPAPHDTAERRQLTVMFTDLVGSTALSTRLDPEDLRSVIAAYHRCCTEVAERSGGFVAKYMGDGVLVYFGYPQAHEDDAERAVRAGLALGETVPKLATEAGSPLQVRVGIATGLVVVGDLIGAGAAQEQAVVGETPNLAARLQALAEPGAVMIADSTRRLTGRLFEYRDLGTVALKGFAENVPAWQVLGASAVESRFEALRATTTSLVGRDEEIDLLIRRWEQAKRGDGQVVLICGEPGIGKSRIAQTIVERISGEPHTRLRYFCSPHHQDSALYPSIAQLERAAGFRREDTPEQRLSKLEAVLAQGTNDLREAVPLFADLLSIPTGDRYPPLNLTPQKRKERTLHAQLAQVEGLAARQPVLMVFEDVHWSDPTTRDSLDLLVDRVAVLPVLVILTFRPEFTPASVGRPHVALLTLTRLPPRQRIEMIAHVTGGKPLPKQIADQIVDRTDGVPLFIEELTKSVVESGIVIQAGDHYTVAGPVAPLAIPTSLHASLLARLDRLAPTREVAQIGAALGRSFSHELIGAVAAMPHHKLDDALDRLVRAELIFRRGTPPEAEYTFKHALVQDAAYGTLLRSRRQQLHARIATTLEGRFPEIVTAQPALAARHCAEAGLFERATAYRMKAGQQATARSAMVEAEAHFRKGLEHLAGLPDGVERQQYELALQTALGMTVIVTHGYGAPEVANAFARARHLCEQLDQPSQLAALVVGECQYHIVRGELMLACQEAKEIVNLGEVRDNADVKFQGSVNSAIAWFHVGDFLASRAYAEQALTLYDPSHPSIAWWPNDPHILACIFLFRSLTYLGYLDQARHWRDEALALARQRRQFQTVAFVLAIAFEITDLARLAPAILLQEVEELTALCAEHALPYWAPIALVWRGVGMAALGHGAEAVTMITESLNNYRATGSVVTVPVFLTLLAGALGKANRATEALERLDEAEHQIAATEERFGEARAQRVRGELLLAVGEPVAAEQSFCQAIMVANRQCAKMFELPAAVNLARLWRDRGKRTEARDLLAPIYHWFTEGFDTPVLKEAKALLDELSGDASASVSASHAPGEAVRTGQ
jgi:class 3 adenylate cyclase/predicted ATPase